MPLENLTDPQAINAAIKEFDLLGREAFLKKYGFGKAHSYFILYRDGRYDSKAIVGAAYGIQYPGEGALKSDAFSGGEQTVAQKVRALGFEITTTGFHLRSPKYWALKANPRRYRIADAVKHLDEDYWTTARSDIRDGDYAIIWQTLDTKGRRGIVAFAEIVADPEIRADDENPYWVDPADGGQLESRVLVRYILPSNIPLWIDNTATGDFLRSLSVARAQGGTVFHLTEQQWQRLADLTSFKPISPDEVEVESEIRYRTKKGQGFGLTIAERKAVEIYAMELATRHFRLTWDTVEDVSSKCSFDLLCRRGLEELRVEVKGTTTVGDVIILTKNEVREADDPGYVIFVVSEIQLDRSNPTLPKASGGRCRKIDPVNFDKHLLKPISYTYEIDWSKGTEVSDFAT